LNPRGSGYGWVVVAAAFTLMFVGFTAAYSFAAFFTAFESEFGALHGHRARCGERLVGLPHCPAEHQEADRQRQPHLEAIGNSQGQKSGRKRGPQQRLVGRGTKRHAVAHSGQR